MSSSAVALAPTAAATSPLVHSASALKVYPASDCPTSPGRSAFAAHSPMSTASTASGSDSPSTTSHGAGKGTLATFRCSSPERQHSPLSLDSTTASNSAVSSRAPSPTCAHLTFPPSLATSNNTTVSPAISPLSHPVSPPSPAHSDTSRSSSASSEHSTEPGSTTTPTGTSTTSSSSSSNYRPARLHPRSKRIPLSSSQKALLEEFFRTNHYPTRDEKTELGNRINLSSDKVHKWSARTRTRHSHRLRVSFEPATHSPFSNLLSLCSCTLSVLVR